MPEVHRLTDSNSAGAPITSVRQRSVYVNNKLVSVDGSPVKPHGVYPHASPFTANGSKTVFAERIPVNFRGNPDTCGHPRAKGSSDVYVEGK